MCVHELTNSQAFQRLAKKFAEVNKFPITLVDYSRDRNYSMFVDPTNFMNVRRAYTDLKAWHPDARLSDQSRLMLVRKGNTSWEEAHNIHTIPGRNVPDSLDLEEDDFDAVYNRCAKNGYFRSVQEEAL